MWEKTEDFLVAGFLAVATIVAVAAAFIRGAPFSDWSPVIGVIAYLFICVCCGIYLVGASNRVQSVAANPVQEKQE